MLLKLPPELLLRIIAYITDVSDKCELLKTCHLLNRILSNHTICWNQLDLSRFDEKLTTGTLLNFLKRVNIPLYTTFSLQQPQTAAHIQLLDLSGCWNLSDDLIATLSKSLLHLKELHLNGYRLHNNRIQTRHPAVGFEQQRDHVYQVRPAHDLASMAMDLSKKKSHRLKVPLVLLTHILEKLPDLKRLSIQYQDLTSPFPAHLNRLESLDISSCSITQPVLQALLRTAGPHLTSLKMLNIDLNHLTCLTLTQFVKRLTTLHLSCNEPGLLPTLRQVIAQLPLEDFRLTRIRTGNLNGLIRPGLIRLDLSPKMSIYPKRYAIPVRKHHPPQSPQIASYTSTEHALQLTELNQTGLVELRLCFPTASLTQLEGFLKANRKLEILELRLVKSDGVLRGLEGCRYLKELWLFSVPVPVEDLLGLDRLERLVLCEMGQVKPEMVLGRLPRLRLLGLGKLPRPVEWSVPYKVHDPHNVTFYKPSSDSSWIIH